MISCYPPHGDKNPLIGNLTYARVAFTEPKTNAKQERLTGTIRTGETSSYVVDIFCSAHNDKKDKKHEYFYHGIGQGFDVMTATGQQLTLAPTNELSSALGDMKGYNYFTNKKAISYGQDFKARLNVRMESRDDVFMDMWST